MTQLQLPRDESTVYKKRRTFRTCNSHFMYVKCKDCSSTTICYSHSQKNVNCQMCSTPILKATGGRAKLLGGAASKIVENQY